MLHIAFIFVAIIQTRDTNLSHLLTKILQVAERHFLDILHDSLMYLQSHCNKFLKQSLFKERLFIYFLAFRKAVAKSDFCLKHSNKSQ